MDSQSLSSFEEKVRLATQLPVPPPEFVEGLWHRIAVQSSTGRPSTPQGKRRLRLRPAWLVMGAVVFALITITLILGPARVYAAVRQLLGYIPGVGIVDETVPIRVLSEPVSVTRDGITVTVTSAFLTGDGTRVEYRIFGVPRAAYPDREDVVGCVRPEYLRLPDGTRLERTGSMGEMPPVPATVNNAVFVLPCIANTLSGAAPENWELNLAFVPAPPELTVFPVVDLSPSPEPTTDAAGTPTIPQGASVSFDRVIETNNGYILVGRFLPSVPPGQWVQVTDVRILDANGRDVAYASPSDVQPPQVEDTSGGFGFVFEFNGAGLVYPLSVEFSGVTIHGAGPEAQAEVEFDAGPNPQPGQEWVLNQDLELAGHHLTLVSITADSRPGYSFHFETGPDVYGASVTIPGTTPVGGGGGGSGGLTNGTFNVDIGYTELPAGRLRVAITDLTVIGDAHTWEGLWSPASPRTDWPPTPTPGGYAMPSTADQLQPPPAEVTSGGLALTYEPIDADEWGLVLHGLDGSGRALQVPGGTWGTLSPDGRLMAYPSTDGIHVIDLETRSEKVLGNGLSGFNLQWSADGRQIAFVGDGADHVYVLNLDGSPARAISDQAFTSVIGWSPEGEVYVAIPFTGGSAWQVRAINPNKEEWSDLFVIENGTPKFLSPALSPDGEWIAYRGRDNSSLYMIRIDGTDMHLLMTGVAQAVWSHSGWMGVTVFGPETDQLRTLLVQSETCIAYLVPTAHGYLEALYMR
jgi:hypothetical protein